MRRSRKKPIPTIQAGLNWRDGLVDFIDRIGYDGAAFVQEALDEHAHELAEQQRRWADEENFILPVEVDGRDVPTIARQVARILADQIDPKAEK